MQFAEGGRVPQAAIPGECGVRAAGTCGSLRFCTEGEPPRAGAPSPLWGLAAPPQPEPPERLPLGAALGKERKGAERSRWMFIFPG